MAIEILFVDGSQNKIIDRVVTDQDVMPITQLARLKGWNMFPGDTLKVREYRKGDEDE